MIVQRLHHAAPPTLTAMIVDADVISIRRLKAAIKDAPRISVGCTARTIASAIEQAEQLRPDIVFLDMTLADGAGIAVARRLSPATAIVVVSDRPEHAFGAFELGAIDYLLKPINADRLRATLRRIDRFFSHAHDIPTEAGMASSPGRLTFVDRVQLPAHASSQRKSTDLVPVSDVIWVESLQNYSIVQLPGSDRRSIKRSLTEWASLLPVGEFVRIGRSHLIQVARVQTFASLNRSEGLAYFRDVSEPLRLGRAAAGKLRAILRGSRPA